MNYVEDSFCFEGQRTWWFERQGEVQRQEQRQCQCLLARELSDDQWHYVLDFKDENAVDLQSNTRGVPPDEVLAAASSKDSRISVLQQDRAAHITIDGKRRPRFRYGSGKWGKALYRVSITSTLTMNAFHAFALPDPEESREPWTHDRHGV